MAQELVDAGTFDWKAGGKYPLDAENTGHTFVPVKYYEPYVASTPTSCQMKRP